MPLLVLISIISFSCWLNLTHGMNGKTDEKTETRQDLQNQASTEQKADIQGNPTISVASVEKSTKLNPQRPAVSVEVLNLDYEADQIKFLSKLIPIIKKTKSPYFENYHDHFETTITSNGRIYRPKIDLDDTYHNWFMHAKNDIINTLGKMNPDNSSISSEERATLKKLKETIYFYLNPIDGAFKTSDIKKILADSNCQLTVRTHKRKGKIHHAETVFHKDGKRIYELSKEELEHASSSSRSIQEIFNPEKRPQDQLEIYYEDLDKRSDPETINTRTIIYYALVHICGAEHLKKYISDTLQKKKKTQKRTTRDMKRLVEHNNQDRIPKGSNPSPYYHPTEQGYTTTQTQTKHSPIKHKTYQTSKRSNPASYGRPAAQGYTTTQTHKKHSSMRHERHQTPERSNPYRSDSEEPIKREVKITTVGGKPRVYRKLKRPGSTS